MPYLSCTPPAPLLREAIRIEYIFDRLHVTLLLGVGLARQPFVSRTVAVYGYAKFRGSMNDSSLPNNVVTKRLRIEKDRIAILYVSIR